MTTFCKRLGIVALVLVGFALPAMAQPDAVNVFMRQQGNEFRYDPMQVTIATDGSVQFTNPAGSNVNHSARSFGGSPRTFDTGTIEPGRSVILDFNTAPVGAYDFYCAIDQDPNPAVTNSHGDPNGSFDAGNCRMCMRVRVVQASPAPTQPPTRTPTPSPFAIPTPGSSLPPLGGSPTPDFTLAPIATPTSTPQFAVGGFFSPTPPPLQTIGSDAGDDRSRLVLMALALFGAAGAASVLVKQGL